MARAGAPSYTGAVTTRTSPFTLLDAVAKELSALLESGRLPRTARTDARRLLTESWLLLEGPRGPDRAPDADALARRLDALVARHGTPTGAPAPALPHPDRLNVAARVDRPPAAPLRDRLEALEAGVDALARRTRRMVEHAEAAARRTARLSGEPPPPREAGREDLELVWGDDER